MITPITGSIVMPRAKLEVIFAMAITKRQADEADLPKKTELLQEMERQYQAIKKGKHITIV